jgi:hypothetical protein
MGVDEHNFCTHSAHLTTECLRGTGITGYPIGLEEFALTNDEQIKADRNETGASTEDTIAKLQEESVKAAKK